VSILVVEDDIDLRLCISEALSCEGFLVRGAADADDALNWLGTHTPDLILLDLMLPTIDGVEFRRRQLADARLAQIPTVVISAASDGKRIARELAATDFIAKPLSLDELLHVVQNQAVTVPRVEHNLRGALRLMRSRS
jgi:DNA-binding response OmpR family regulator